MLKILVIILLMLNAFMFYKLVWTESGALQLREIQQAYRTLEERNNALVQENKQLSRTIIALRNDKEYIKNAIRREIRYVQENEVIYFFPQDNEP